MALVNMKALLRDAQKGGYAVGSFSVANLEMILGVIKAAEETRSPIILQIAEVDIIMFGRQITLMSFLYAAALASAFSLFVNLVLHKKLKSVDMVESLKSIE